MITDLLDLVLSTTLLVVTLLLGTLGHLPASSRVRCPAGWYVNGVRPGGDFECRPVVGEPENDILDAVRRRAIADDRALAGRVYCTGGATPRQDGESVWCQR